MSSNLFLTGKGTWFVFDEEMFCFGVGETPDEAIESTRKQTNKAIDTYWGVVEDGAKTIS